ncbi:MAG: transglycosylase SLT domain-containing protein [Arcobacteraceae bacterium]|nr:transglycosylase SLT domain-containing protein [Arcobacteraceae bacterium]
MKYSKVVLLYLFLLSSSLFSSSINVKALNNSLQNMQCQEVINHKSPFFKMIKKYNTYTKSKYNRYLQTKDTHKKIYQKLKHHHIPSFFSLIPYHESGFNPKIKNNGTAGLWQLSVQSGKFFGLTINKKKDERLDINRSTDAAIQYFIYLKKKYYKWYLVDFAYGMGEKRLDTLIAKNKTDKFSTLIMDSTFPKGMKSHFIKILLLDARIFHHHLD